jgi:thiol-disulfide isomerase/thioredoxin
VVLFFSLLLLVLPAWTQSAKKVSPKAWIGISFLDVPTVKMPPEYKHLSPDGAVQIQQVFKGASGYQAGLQSGDFILAIDRVSLNGRQTLLETVGKKSVGDILELKIGRAGKTFLQKMALSPKPEDVQSITKLLEGSQAPELEGAFYSNQNGGIKENHGKVILLDFWATWCKAFSLLGLVPNHWPP